jgi:hypothetical protein
MRHRFIALAGLAACASFWACGLIAGLGDPPSLIAAEAGPEGGSLMDAGIAHDGPDTGDAADVDASPDAPSDASPDFLGVGFARLPWQTRSRCVDFEQVIADDGGADASGDAAAPNAAPDASEGGPEPIPSGEFLDVGFTVGASGTIGAGGTVGAGGTDLFDALGDANPDLFAALYLGPAALAPGLAAANDPRAAYLVGHPVTPRTVQAVLSVRVAGPGTQIFPTGLTAAATALVADAGAFSTVCGDAFVDTERPQIGFFAALEIETLNAREYADIVDELTAIHDDFVAILDPSEQLSMLQQAIEAALGSKVVHVWTYGMGSAAPKKSCLDDLTCVFQNLLTTSRATPDARLDLAPFHVTPYDVPLPAPDTGSAAVTAAQSEQHALADSLCAARDLVASIDDVTQHPADYPSANPTALAQARLAEWTYAESVATALGACSVNAADCNTSLAPPAPPSLPARSIGTNLAAGPDPTKDDSGFEQQPQPDPVALPWQSFCVDLSHVGLTLAPDGRMAVSIDRLADHPKLQTAHWGLNNGVVVTSQSQPSPEPSASLCGLSQQVAVQPSHTYSVGAWLRSDGLQQGELGVVAAPGAAPLSTVTFRRMPVRYHYRALTFNSGSNTSVTLYMQMYGSGEDPALSYVQIDDVTLFETAAVDAGSEQ